MQVFSLIFLNISGKTVSAVSICSPTLFENADMASLLFHTRSLVYGTE